LTSPVQLTVTCFDALKRLDIKQPLPGRVAIALMMNPWSAYFHSVPADSPKASFAFHQGSSFM
jgi:hypothetical protein